MSLLLIKNAWLLLVSKPLWVTSLLICGQQLYLHNCTMSPRCFQVHLQIIKMKCACLIQYCEFKLCDKGLIPRVLSVRHRHFMTASYLKTVDISCYIVLINTSRIFRKFMRRQVHLDSDVLYIVSFKGSVTFENVLSSLWPFFCSVNELIIRYELLFLFHYFLNIQARCA